MQVNVATQTFAAFVGVCAECQAEVSWIEYAPEKATYFHPCGHRASIKFVPNPRLTPRPPLV